MNYAIVQPTLAGFGTIVGFCVQPEAVVVQRPLVCVELKGRANLALLGSELPYRAIKGGYEEVHLDTSREGT